MIARRHRTGEAGQEALMGRLYPEIGPLKVGLGWLENKVGSIEQNDRHSTLEP
jgi:hypothetical protein